MPIQIFAILLTIIGIIFSAFNFQKIAMKNIFSKGSFFALVTMVLWGAYFSLVKIPTQLIGWYWPAFMIRVLVILFIPLLISQKNLSMSRFATKKLFVFILAAAVLSGFGDVIYNLGISHSDISYFSPIASASPIFYAVIASRVYRDKVARIQNLGIIMAIIGIIMINF
jgi:drug/metabolite transporter (DMT)-like permease